MRLGAITRNHNRTLSVKGIGPNSNITKPLHLEHVAAGSNPAPPANGGLAQSGRARKGTGLGASELVHPFFEHLQRT